MWSLRDLVLDLIDSTNLDHFRALLLTCGFIYLSLFKRFAIELGRLTRVGLFRGFILNLMGLKNLRLFKGLRGLFRGLLLNLMGLRVWE